MIFSPDQPEWFESNGWRRLNLERAAAPPHVLWIDDLDGQSRLKLERQYQLKIYTSTDPAKNLLAGRVGSIDPTDIPDDGLLSRWVLTSRAVSFVSEDIEVNTKDGNSNITTASFDLLIPKSGESKHRHVRITPNAALANISVMIFSLNELAPGKFYTELLREFEVDLPIEE